MTRAKTSPDGEAPAGVTAEMHLKKLAIAKAQAELEEARTRASMVKLERELLIFNTRLGLMKSLGVDISRTDEGFKAKWGTIETEGESPDLALIKFWRKWVGTSGKRDLVGLAG